MKEILESYKLPELKKMVRATNITGYSKLKKDELIKLMIRPENIDRFKSIKPKSARLPPVPEEKTKPKMKVLRELKKKYPKYKEYIQFYEKTGFTLPSKLPPPPKWLLEGKPPPSGFKIPKIIITEIKDDQAKKAKPQVKKSVPEKQSSPPKGFKVKVPPKKEQPKKEQPKKEKKKPELPIVVKNNKDLKKLFEGKSVKTMKVILEITNDLIELFESDSAKDVMEGRIQLDEEDDLVKETLSILEPQLYLKNISVESDPTGKKQKQEEEREKSPKKKK